MIAKYGCVGLKCALLAVQSICGTGLFISTFEQQSSSTRYLIVFISSNSGSANGGSLSKDATNPFRVGEQRVAGKL